MEVEVDWAFEEAKIGSLSWSSFLSEKVDESSERVESGESAIVERSPIVRVVKHRVYW